MGMYKKLADGNLQKLAGYTVIADGSCAEIRHGTFSGGSIAPNTYATVTVTFTDPMPDTDYTVVFMNSAGNAFSLCQDVGASQKTVNGFTCHISNLYDSALTPTFEYYAFKLIPMEGYTELKNKVDNPDTTPTENSTNLCTSGGIYDFVKNASSIFVGTSTEWAAATQTDYDIAVITDEHKILSIDKTAGTTAEQANLNKIFRGTLAEWEALSQSEKDYYDQAEIDDDNIAIPEIPMKYSTTEQDTGMKWIDGKPIYRKVVRGIPVSNTWAQQTIDSSNQESLVDYSIVGHGSGSSAGVQTTPYYNIASDNFQVALVAGSGRIDCWCAASSITEFDVVIQYTKTTD